MAYRIIKAFRGCLCGWGTVSKKRWELNWVICDIQSMEISPGRGDKEHAVWGRRDINLNRSLMLGSTKNFVSGVWPNSVINTDHLDPLRIKKLLKTPEQKNEIEIIFSKVNLSVVYSALYTGCFGENWWK